MIAAADLLRYEADLRETRTVHDYLRRVADTTPDLVPCDRVLIFRQKFGRWRLEVVSHVSSIEPNAPAVRKLERENGTAIHAFEPRDERGPLRRIILVRPAPLDAAERRLVERLVPIWSQGLRAHGCRAARPPVPVVAKAALAAGLVVAGFLKAPLTALAPFEVVAREPVAITSPLDGVVEAISVPADQPVAAGRPVALLDGRDLRAELELAERRLELAETRLTAARKNAFGSQANRSDVVLARAERSVAAAERDARAELYTRTVLTAPVAGIALHSGREGWAGRRVRAGEKLMEIADPDDVAARIELAVSDALVIAPGAPVRLYPDGSLTHRDAVLERASYLPEPTADGRLVYPLHARFDGPMRIGLRGTARIEGQRVTFWYRVLRRPLAALRQRVGW